MPSVAVLQDRDQHRLEMQRSVARNAHGHDHPSQRDCGDSANQRAQLDSRKAKQSIIDQRLGSVPSGMTISFPGFGANFPPAQSKT